MFTGLITDVGTVRGLERRGDLRVRIGTAYDPASIEIGASIACDGCCLTVVDRGAGDGAGPDAGHDRDRGGWFAVDVSAESLARTRLGDWREGTRVNLERSLRLGDEMGGHIVSGHVDGVARIAGLAAEGDSLRLTLEAPEALARFVAPKGSVALNGTSLTVNEVEGARFGVNLIPHTREVTSWGEAREGDRVNLEIDMLARYVARLRDWA
jgi:riboflavin synthase